MYSVWGDTPAWTRGFSAEIFSSRSIAAPTRARTSGATCGAKPIPSAKTRARRGQPSYEGRSGPAISPTVVVPKESASAAAALKFSAKEAGAAPSLQAITRRIQSTNDGGIGSGIPAGSVNRGICRWTCALTSPGTIAAPGNSIRGKPAGAARRTSALGPASRTFPSATATAPGENDRPGLRDQPRGDVHDPLPPVRRWLHTSRFRGQTAAATRGRWLSDSIFRFTPVIRFFPST